jgi:2-oxoglutarate ferredoxin oxidoreductase subunit beta
MTQVENPIEQFLRVDRLPHIWCSGCGVGIVVSCFARALLQSQTDVDSIAVVSGIGCTGRIAGYLRMDSFHTTHGRPIPFATGLKLARPEKQVVVFSGEGDLIAIGGNHLIHAARRNADIKVFCVNNFTYGMTGGQVAPTSPPHSLSTTTPYGAFERPFNLPQLADAVGAVYVARWTTYHVRQLTRGMAEAMKKPGFCFVEIIAPCPTIYGRRNRLGNALETMRFFKQNTRLQHGADTRTLDIELGGPIVVGTFVNRERPTLLQAMNKEYSSVLKERFVPYPAGPDQ